MSLSGQRLLGFVWVGHALTRKNFDFASLHEHRIVIVLVIVALQMKRAVNDEMGVMMLNFLALPARFFRDNRRAQHDVPG